MSIIFTCLLLLSCSLLNESTCTPSDLIAPVCASSFVDCLGATTRVRRTILQSCQPNASSSSSSDQPQANEEQQALIPRQPTRTRTRAAEHSAAQRSRPNDETPIRTSTSVRLRPAAAAAAAAPNSIAGRPQRPHQQQQQTRNRDAAAAPARGRTPLDNNRQRNNPQRADAAQARPRPNRPQAPPSPPAVVIRQRQHQQQPAQASPAHRQPTRQQPVDATTRQRTVAASRARPRQPLTIDEHLAREHAKFELTKPQSDKERNEAAERRIHAYFDRPDVRHALLVSERRPPSERAVSSDTVRDVNWNLVRELEPLELDSPGWRPYQSALWQFYNSPGTSDEYRSALLACQHWLSQTRALIDNSLMDWNAQQVSEFLQLVHAVWQAHPRDKSTSHSPIERARNALRHHLQAVFRMQNQHDETGAMYVLALHLMERIPPMTASDSAPSTSRVGP